MSVERMTLSETLAGNRTITAAEFSKYEVFIFDPGGSGRDVTLPAEATSGSSTQVQSIVIINSADGAEVLTIKNDAGTGVGGATPTQNECSVLYCDGTSWFSHGETT